MTELLNQKAIDRLMGKGSSPEPAADVQHEVRSHSFLRPVRLAQEQRADLGMILGSFAQALQKTLSVHLRTPVEVSVTGIEEVLFSELLLSLGSPCAAFLFPVGPRRGDVGVLDWGTETAFSLVDRLLGGDGEAIDLRRGLTRLERGVVRDVTERTLRLLRDAWKEHLSISPELQGFESDPARIKVAGPEDRVLTMILEIRSDKHRGISTIGLPAAALKSMLQAEAAGPGATSSKDEPVDDRTVMGSSLKHAHLAISARFPNVILGASAVAGLRKDQVIHTGHALDTPAEVYVNERFLFLGSVGQVNGHIGLRISERAVEPVPERLTHMRQGRVL
jgi:flagellar motor switch protein FliM